MSSIVLYQPKESEMKSFFASIWEAFKIALGSSIIIAGIMMLMVFLSPHVATVNDGRQAVIAFLQTPSELDTLKGYTSQLAEAKNKIQDFFTRTQRIEAENAVLKAQLLAIESERELLKLELREAKLMDYRRASAWTLMKETAGRPVEIIRTAIN
jgi:hypothetical protein